LSKKKSSAVSDYAGLLKDVKARIQQAQTRAMLSVNAELVRLYWDIGRLIDQRQLREGWGASVIPTLSRDLHNELPEVKGFSERNIKLMVQFAHEYPAAFAPLASIGQPPVAQLPTRQKGQPLVAQIPWAHNVLLMQRVKNTEHRSWYMQQTLANGWSRNVLTMMIKSGAHARQGKAVTNFARLLPSPQSDLAKQTLKDPYIFDFLTLAEPFRERELETNLLLHLEKFLLELGQGFAFVGRQYRLEIGDDEFSIDLVFYHLKLRSFVVIDLKTGAFKAEYAGKMNLYLSALDDQLRHPTDAPTVGLILCQDRNRVVAEYALRGMTQPIGVSEYELTRTLPRELRSSLPSIDEIEAELSGPATNRRAVNRRPVKKKARRKRAKS
jgi:predicted nuclease of restriction endonuclease-like (RecB) superfamily